MTGVEGWWVWSGEAWMGVVWVGNIIGENGITVRKEFRGGRLGMDRRFL
jgi:hypothetical protein